MTVLFIIFIGINITAMILGNLVEIIKLPKWLDFKPFNCKKCLSTHICWVLNTLVALIAGSAFYFIAGIAAAATIYYLIDNEDKAQFE